MEECDETYEKARQTAQKQQRYKMSEEEDEEEQEWCEVGEHYVEAEDMWENFADCYECATWKEYVEYYAERFDLEYCNDCQVVEGNSDWHTCPHQAKLVASPAPVSAPAPADE